MKKYTVAFSYTYKKWCVFEGATASLRLFYQKCESEEEAEKLADQLNQEEK